MKHKPKHPTANDIKAEIIKRHGTIQQFACVIGVKPATVYSAIKYRRNGPTAKAIRAEVFA